MPNLRDIYFQQVTIINNEHGAFIVLINEEEAEKLSRLLNQLNINFVCITSFGQYMNAIKLA